MREELRAHIRMILQEPGARLHLIGVAGSGMSALARLLLQGGYTVSGSDLQRPRVVEKLIELGLRFYPQHTAQALEQVRLVVYSSAINADNEERRTATERGLLVVRRAELLSILAESKQPLVVAGMHGKTTTSCMLAYVLRMAGAKPSHYIGAEVPILGSNAEWGSGEHLVIEGDESDGTLTVFRPAHGLILNIEEEHLDYYQNLEEILHVFAQFAENTTGHLIYCADDPNTMLLCAHRPRTISYGLSEHAYYQGQHVRFEDFSSTFEVKRAGVYLGLMTLNLPGIQNVRNALGVVALALELGLPWETISLALSEFRGAQRRFEVKHKSADFLVVDDYAHHPTEIKATLAAARAGGWARIVALFQPHRYSRTKHLLEEFSGAFTDADVVILTDVYAASEMPMEGVNGQVLADAVQKSGHAAVHYLANLSQLLSWASQEIRPGDLVLTLGAGNIHEVAAKLSEELDFFVALKNKLSAEARLLRREPMSKHTSLRVGGPAQFWCEPATDQDLAEVLRLTHVCGVPVTLIGRGTNLLVKDGGISGLCLHLGHKHFSSIQIVGHFLEVGAGARLKSIVMEARRHGLGGLSFLEGIPGNLGGALRMNAGAMKGWTMEVVEEVRTIDLQGQRHRFKRDELEVNYRSVPIFSTHIAIGARLRAVPLPLDKIDQELKELSKKRWTSQPAAPSAGCIFKNPDATPAGKLIDELGLKNLSVGKARISDVHGNFIVNDGGATAVDVLQLISLVQARARESRGVELEPEVMILGENK